MEDVFKLLDATEEGLTTERSSAVLAFSVPTNSRARKNNPILQVRKSSVALLSPFSRPTCFFHSSFPFMWNPLSWVMEAAAIVAIALSNGGGKPPDWPDFVGIVFLLFVNSSIGFYEERNAGNAVKALMDSLAPKAKSNALGNGRRSSLPIWSLVTWFLSRLVTSFQPTVA
jgi:H+-transporting ATPase